MIATEEPILSRLDRLDTILRHFEERRASNNINRSSARSSYASSSGTPTSDGQDASSDFSPRSVVEKNHCRPIDDVRSETHLKGNLLHRMLQLEDQVLKLEVELEPPENKAAAAAAAADGKKKHKKGLLKQRVKSWVQGHKDKTNKNS